MSEWKREGVIRFLIILVINTKLISRLLGMMQLFGKSHVLELICQNWTKKKRGKY